MSRLEELLQTLCPYGVKYKSMWELTTWDKRFNGLEKYKQPSVKKYHYYLANELKALATTEGNVKLLYTSTADQGVTTEKLAGEHLAEGEIVAIPWGGNPQVQYYNGKFITSDNRIATSNDKERLSNKFLYYWMINNLPIIDSFYRGSGIKHPSMAKVLDMKVPVPPLPVQEEIVRILDTFTALETELGKELEAELAARTKQYDHYRNELLSFDSNSKIIEKLLADSCQDGVEYKKLGDIAPPTRGVRVVKSQLSLEGGFPVYQNSMTPLGYYEDNNCPAKTAFIISAGAAGEVGYSNVDFWAADDCFYFKCPQRLLSRFLYHYLKTQQDFLLSRVRRASVPRLAREVVEGIKIPILPVPVQEQIISILDRFDTLANDLKSGLPAEIALRRKQYEYYRDKLLAFQPLN